MLQGCEDQTTPEKQDAEGEMIELIAPGFGVISNPVVPSKTRSDLEAIALELENRSTPAVPSKINPGSIENAPSSREFLTVATFGPFNSGKTTLTKTILNLKNPEFYNKCISKTPNTCFNYEREIGIKPKIYYYKNAGSSVGLIDCPGYLDYKMNSFRFINSVDCIIYVVGGNSFQELQKSFIELNIIMKSFGIKNIILCFNTHDLIATEKNQTPPTPSEQRSNISFFKKLAKKYNFNNTVIGSVKDIDTGKKIISLINKTRRGGNIKRKYNKPFIMTFTNHYKLREDYIIAGHILQGRVKKNDRIYIGDEFYYIKNIQVARKDKDKAIAGEIVALKLYTPQTIPNYYRHASIQSQDEIFFNLSRKKDILIITKEKNMPSKIMIGIKISNTWKIDKGPEKFVKGTQIILYFKSLKINGIVKLDKDTEFKILTKKYENTVIYIDLPKSNIDYLFNNIENEKFNIIGYNGGDPRAWTVPILTGQIIMSEKTTTPKSS